MFDSTFIAILDLVLGLIACYLSHLWLSRRLLKENGKLPLPPGPRGWPLIGNLMDMPTASEASWKVYHKWCKELDTGIMYLNVAGSSIIILDTYEDCLELLEKRSSRYSGRTRMPMINELMGYEFQFALADYGDSWRQRRRLMHDSFHPAASKAYQPLQLRVARKFVTRLTSETDIISALRQMAGEIIISIAYGLEVQAKNDPYIKAAEAGVKNMENVPAPGAFLVDVLPILLYVPAWMPGASFKRKAREWRVITEKMVNLPFEGCLREIEKGTAKPSFTYNGLQNMALKGGIYKEENIKSVAASMYAAGADSTLLTISSCFLSLLENPASMKKIQAEIDSATDGKRLPDFEDKENLPYLIAFIKEVMRYWTLLPLSVPHYVPVEDEYKGFRIPAGSNVIPNTWAIHRDEKVFPDPFTFMPDRFLSGTDDELKVRNAHYNTAYGYGRRICPGRHMASASIWITLAHILAVYDVSKAKYEHGNIIEPSREPQTLGLITTPPAYKCVFTLRSEAAGRLLVLCKDSME